PGFTDRIARVELRNACPNILRLIEVCLRLFQLRLALFDRCFKELRIDGKEQLPLVDESPLIVVSLHQDAFDTRTNFHFPRAAYASWISRINVHCARLHRLDGDRYRSRSPPTLLLRAAATAIAAGERHHSDKEKQATGAALVMMLA